LFSLISLIQEYLNIRKLSLIRILIILRITEAIIIIVILPYIFSISEEKNKTLERITNNIFGILDII
jgi:hypothetical protein